MSLGILKAEAKKKRREDCLDLAIMKKKDEHFLSGIIFLGVKFETNSHGAFVAYPGWYKG